MEVFEQETSHAVMTGILLYDLNDKRSVANPKNALRNPLELFASGAFHGGCASMRVQERPSHLTHTHSCKMIASGAWRTRLGKAVFRYCFFSLFCCASVLT